MSTHLGHVPGSKQELSRYGHSVKPEQSIKQTSIVTVYIANVTERIGPTTTMLLIVLQVFTGQPHSAADAWDVQSLYRIKNTVSF